MSIYTDFIDDDDSSVYTTLLCQTEKDEAAIHKASKKKNFPFVVKSKKPPKRERPNETANNKDVKGMTSSSLTSMKRSSRLSFLKHERNPKAERNVGISTNTVEVKETKQTDNRYKPLTPHYESYSSPIKTKYPRDSSKPKSPESPWKVSTAFKDTPKYFTSTTLIDYNDNSMDNPAVSFQNEMQKMMTNRSSPPKYHAKVNAQSSKSVCHEKLWNFETHVNCDEFSSDCFFGNEYLLRNQRVDFPTTTYSDNCLKSESILNISTSTSDTQSSSNGSFSSIGEGDINIKTRKEYQVRDECTFATESTSINDEIYSNPSNETNSIPDISPPSPVSSVDEYDHHHSHVPQTDDIPKTNITQPCHVENNPRTKLSLKSINDVRNVLRNSDTKTHHSIPDAQETKKLLSVICATDELPKTNTQPCNVENNPRTKLSLKSINDVRNVLRNSDTKIHHSIPDAQETKKLLSVICAIMSDKASKEKELYSIDLDDKIRREKVDVSGRKIQLYTQYILDDIKR